jgi:Lrp/AsnC family transcriptional regulator for asnA, asnC and gidA
LDELDKNILAQLQEDGRRPFTEIADRLGGKSEGMVRNRVHRLLDEGIISIQAVVNPKALGYDTQALIGIIVEPPLIEAAAQALLKYEEVTYLAWSSGSVDLLVQVVCQDNEHFVDFMSNKLNQVKGIKSTETHMILRTYRQSATWGSST